MTVSPEQATADLTTLETKPVEEGSGVPVQASQPDPTDAGLTPGSMVGSYVYVRPGGLQRRTTLVTGSLMQTYCVLDVEGTEVEESWNRPPQEISAPPLSTMPPEGDRDVELSGRDQYEYPASDGSESTVTVGTPHNSQDNTSSGSSVVTNTPVLVVSSQYQLKISKMSQMVRKRKATYITLKSQEMRLRGKHNPRLHFELKSHASSLEESSTEYIILHAHLDVSPNYNRILDTAKFNILISTIDHSASNTRLPMPQPQSQEFTLAQENKHMEFKLFPHSFVLNSTRSSIDLLIEVQLIYYTQPEENVMDYEEKNPTESLDFVDIQSTTATSLKLKVIAEYPVSVTNEEQTKELKEQGLILHLHVPKNSLPEGCNQTCLTIFFAQPDTSNQAQNSRQSRYILYRVNVGEEPEGMTLKTCCDPQSQGSEPPTHTV